MQKRRHGHALDFDDVGRKSFDAADECGSGTRSATAASRRRNKDFRDGYLVNPASRHNERKVVEFAAESPGDGSWSVTQRG